MKRFVCLVIVVLGCQRDGGAPNVAPKSTYASDIEKLCDVLTRSGADQLAEEEHQLHTANWLAANLESPESRQFLVKIQPLNGVAKADALDAEARKQGLSSCALASRWRMPPAL